jgi:nucleoside 2-deoxyribosyltransferase
MSTTDLFGITWKNENLDPFININVLTNDHVGKVIFTLNCLLSIDIDNEWNEYDIYKLISLIHEKSIYGKPYFIYKENGKDILKQQGLNLEEYTIVEKREVLNDFPKNIIEIQRRSLGMLYRRYPKYGDYIENILTYDFFSEDYNDWLFVLKAMQQRNWINLNIQETIDGKFVLTQPFFITEEGWFEIEKELERNFSKQVFVAMWFDDKMEKATLKIEEAIKSCGLTPMIINKKEHNNEISGEILLEIMNSRIIIADVTGQRNGVYFEAGFALGHKKSVIWSCQKEDMKNVHFDTRQYNHIIWDNEDDLCKKLEGRLKATIAIENV